LSLLLCHRLPCLMILSTKEAACSVTCFRHDQQLNGQYYLSLPSLVSYLD